MATRHGKGVVLKDADTPLELREFTIPPAQPGGAVIRVAMGGVCGTDVHIRRGEFPLPEPLTLGHEGVGFIEELGPGTHTDYAGEPVKPGDPVYWTPLYACHRCYYCTILKNFSKCENTLGRSHAREGAWGSYADYVCLPAGMAFFKVPNGVPLAAVIAFGCALPSVLQGFERLGPIRSQDSVLIQGCGPVGVAATMMARLSGARKIITMGAPANRLAMARQFGADEVISIEEGTVRERRERVRSLCEGRGPDVIIEAAGQVQALEQGLDMIAPNGRYLLIGLWGGSDKALIDPHLIVRNHISIIGTDRAESRHYYEALRIVERRYREFPMQEMVSHRFSLEHAEEALKAAESGVALKAVMVPGQADFPTEVPTGVPAERRS